MKASTKRIILFTCATAVVLGLLAMRSLEPVPAAHAQVAPPEVINEPSIWNRLFNLPSTPLADCEEVRNWLAEHPGAFMNMQERTGFKAELHYRPASCTACLELGDAQLTDASFLERSRELAFSDQYVLRLYPKEGDGQGPELNDSWTTRIVEIVGTDTVP
jgi:hypothetical protein